MVALRDSMIWSSATILFSRSRLASSRDLTSFSSRHTSSSRCCRSDCHCKQTFSLYWVEDKERTPKCYKAYISHMFAMTSCSVSHPRTRPNDVHYLLYHHNVSLSCDLSIDQTLPVLPSLPAGPSRGQSQPGPSPDTRPCLWWRPAASCSPLSPAGRCPSASSPPPSAAAAPSPWPPASSQMSPDRQSGVNVSDHTLWWNESAIVRATMGRMIREEG